MGLLNKINKKSKHAQHEILGFVLIVLIVAIIGVVFLSFSVGKGNKSGQNSIEMSNLIVAAMYYTTDCAINYVPQYRDVQELIKECYKNPSRKCLNERNVCEVLNYTLKKLIEDSLDTSPDSPNKAYELRIYYTALNNVEADEEIAYFSKGVFQNCTSKLGGEHSVETSSLSSGVINIELEVCRG